MEVVAGTIVEVAASYEYLEVKELIPSSGSGCALDGFSIPAFIPVFILTSIVCEL